MKTFSLTDCVANYILQKKRKWLNTNLLIQKPKHPAYHITGLPIEIIKLIDSFEPNYAGDIPRYIGDICVKGYLTNIQNFRDESDKIQEIKNLFVWCSDLNNVTKQIDESIELLSNEPEHIFRS